MTPDYDQNTTNNEETDRQQQTASPKRKFGSAFLPGLLAVLMVLTGAGALWMSSLRQEAPPSTEPPAESEELSAIETASGETKKPKEDFTVIHIAAAGDLNVTEKTVGDAAVPEGYDFTDTFAEVSPLLSQADLTLLNLEGTFSGAPYGDDRSSAPPELIDALHSMGVDAVQTANSASIRAGILGLQSTYDALYDARILPIGTFPDADAFRDTGGYTIVDVRGLRVALVGFTKGMDNLGLPEGSEDCVNVLYEDYTTNYKKVAGDRIRRVLRKVEEEQPDLTIAMLHWGSEYNEEVSKSQKTIRDILLDGGVDVILGTHPHLVQTIEYDKEASTLVAYSLGDFFGDADQPGSNYSLVLDLEITRDNLTGEVKITGYDYTPIFTVRPEDSAEGGRRVVQTRDAVARYEGNYIGRVTERIYNTMTHSLERVDERIHKELETEE